MVVLTSAETKSVSTTIPRNLGNLTLAAQEGGDSQMPRLTHPRLIGEIAEQYHWEGKRWACFRGGGVFGRPSVQSLVGLGRALS